MTQGNTVTETLHDVVARCDAIEECYEFMLAYAARGLPGDAGGPVGQLRDLLARAAEAAGGLEAAYARVVRDLRLEPQAAYQAFLAVLGRDAGNALAAVNLALAQPRLSSQLIDNLNASMHLRTLLTDIFLIDETVKIARAAGDSAGIPAG
jgi:hypothetical protein